MNFKIALLQIFYMFFKGLVINAMVPLDKATYLARLKSRWHWMKSLPFAKKSRNNNIR